MKTLRLTLGYLRHNLMSAMAYRGAFLLQAVGMLLNNAMLLFFWWVLFTRLPTLRGWTLNQVMLLYAVVAFGFGLAHVICGNSTRVARIIATGDLDYYLALPADPLWHLLVSRMSLPSWGDMLFGLIIFFVATPSPWSKLPLFILLSILAGIVLVAFAVIVGSLAFWIGNADSLAMQAYNAIVTFSLYPDDIFPPVVQWLLYTLIPAALVGSLPAELITQFSWRGLGIILGFTVIITAIARGIFQLGLSRYESGNLVQVRG